MSTDYTLLDRSDGTRLSLVESRSNGFLYEGRHNWEADRQKLGYLTADEIAKMAVEMLKVASYLDPEAIQRTAQHLGEKDDWSYYQGVIRDLL